MGSALHAIRGFACKVIQRVTEPFATASKVIWAFLAKCKKEIVCRRYFFSKISKNATRHTNYQNLKGLEKLLKLFSKLILQRTFGRLHKVKHNSLAELRLFL
jgi:hypothetical protein